MALFRVPSVCYDYPIRNAHAKGGDAGMKKTMSLQALAKEAALWERIKLGAMVPGSACKK